LKTEREGMCSSLYGQKEQTNEIIFESDGMEIDTTIKIG
jgi:hypothetical protein